MPKRNEKVLQKVFKELLKKLESAELVKSGDTQTVEIISAQMILNPKQSILNFPSRRTNEAYVKKELDWYLSQSLSIKGYVDDIEIWNKVCSQDDEKRINSNYGWCIFSSENYDQYTNCLKKLAEDPTTRQAMMIYQRPSMHYDWNKDGMHDFVCTNQVQCFIRDKRLIYIVNQRSCDMIFGFFNDFAWHCWVYDKFIRDMKKQKINVEARKIRHGSIIYNIGSAHVYQRHFELLQKLVTEDIV